MAITMTTDPLSALLSAADDISNPHALGIREAPIGGPVPVFASDEDWAAGMRWYYSRLADDERQPADLRAVWAEEANR